MKIAGIVHESIVDGPNIRSVVFFQGCDHHCLGCHNPQTWQSDGGIDMSTIDIHNELNAHAKCGKLVTFSGGDPLYQLVDITELARVLKSDEYHICVYTGFIWEDIEKDNSVRKLLKYVDLLIDGPFIIDKQSYDLRFRGSSNQRIIDVQASLSTGQCILSPLND